MSIEYKAKLWDQCLKQNIFSNCREDELPRIQELFEQTIEENKDVSPNDFTAIMNVKLKQVSYKDLIPSEKQPIIDFSDNIDEEPLKDIDQLIAAKQKERQNDEPMVKSPVQSMVPSQVQMPVQSMVPSQVKMPVQSMVPSQVQMPVPSQVPSKEIHEIRQMVQNQNVILEKILESQIKILKQLQKK